ncbi:MAG: NADH-quinone oxidoreductase subunit M [Candidatus Eremiobacteraeota bacterium]|nr:NADH-quinone oxidoreductase subunit M [Candidatus Eremiobacteraeota bacterium]
MLLALVLLPIVAGSAMLLLRGEDRRVYRTIGVAVALATLAIAVAARSEDWSAPWLRAPFVANFHLGIGALAFWLIVLLALCTACAVLAVDSARPRALVGQLLLLEGTMLGLFISRDLLLFALFYDLMLVPVFFVLLERGEHPRDAWRYIIYNFAGGLLLLFATAAFGVLHGTTDVIGTAGNAIAGAWAPWIFWGFAIAFLVKTPAFPLHTWMPNTYASLPPPVAAVVGAVQSKAGLYGFFVIGLTLMPQEIARYSTALIVLGAISLLYGAVAALVQTDAKRVVAYSSLSHLGLIVIAIATQQPLALAGAALYIVAHGLFTAALFIGLGYVEEREETRSLARLRGIGASNPRLAGALTIAGLAMLGLPGLAGFVGELVIITGIVQSGNIVVAVVAVISVVLASAYVLRLFQGIVNGPVVHDLPVRRDLTWREGIAIAPLLFALLYLGVNPHAVLASGAVPIARAPLSSTAGVTIP